MVALHTRVREAGKRHSRALTTSVALSVLGALMIIGSAAADNVGGFEIDADHTTVGDALYSGNNAGDDWAQGAANNGIFVPSTDAPHTATGTDPCYGSRVDKNTSATGPSSLICDGNSDSKFRNSEPELNVVSPSGKTPDDIWPVKSGNVRPKNDFSHAYVHASLADSPCETPDDSVADDVMLHMAGHVGDNEGSHFWGFEFDRVSPGGFNQLKNNSGASFNLDFNRTVGDFLISFTVPGTPNDQVELGVFGVSGFVPSGSSAGDAIFVDPTDPDGDGVHTPLPNCPGSAPFGLTKLATNGFNPATGLGIDVKAPPWNIPVCDPTADNGANTCRLANGSTPAEDLLATRDFAEAAVDLTAFGISPCVSNIIFTSRSSHVLEGADIQDVGGADFALCAKKSGTKYEDLNADGDRDDGEPGLGGWPIRLYADDGDKVLEDSDDGTTGNGVNTFRPQVTTAANGSYEFTDLPNGDYIVCESAQPPQASGLPTSGWQQSAPKAGGANIADCAADSSAAARGHAFLMAGVDHTGNDFGNFRNGSISGQKFKDADADGEKDAGETGLGGWVIHLVKADGSGHQTATTDSNGNYSFSSVPPGDYLLCEQTSGKAGWVQSFPTSGADCTGHTDGGTITPGPTGYSPTVTSGQAKTLKDFGNKPESKVQVNFLPQAQLPNAGGNATKATSISCVDKDGNSVGSNSNSNTLTTDAVFTNQSVMVCRITYVDP